MSTKRSLTRILAAGVAVSLLFAACGSTGTPSPAASAAAGSDGIRQSLIDAAKAEGNLTTIALPHSWCDYGDLLTGFTTRYGIKITELNPDGGSGDAVAAIKAAAGSGGPLAPDVIDVGVSFGAQAKTDGLIQPYKVATWDGIPATAKDPDGYWYGDYYGVLSFEVNTAVVKNVPQDWSDLLKPEYKGQVALAGDPTVSNQATSGVWAAGIASGGSLDDAQPGLDFFKRLNDAGNFLPVIAKATTIAGGATPIVIRWTYNALADRDTLAGNPAIAVVVPTSGRLGGGMHVQAISAHAAHPNAAKLWMEYLYSDEGQNTWLAGYCTPIRYDEMIKNGAVDKTAQEDLPDTSGALLPTLDQIAKATEVISKGWPTTVHVTVR